MIPVLHLRSSQGLYGADHALLALAQATALPLRPLVVPLVRAGRKDDLGEAARAAGLDVAPVQSAGQLDAGAVMALHRLILDRQVQVVHAHDYKSLWVGAAACALARVPLVATFHGDCGGSLRVHGYEAAARLLGNAAVACAAVSAPLARKVSAWAPCTRVVHIANGIEVGQACTAEERSQARARLGLAEDELAIAVVGRLSLEKGHRFLAEALRALEKPPAVLLAGEGALKAPWDHAGKARIVRLGFQREVRPVYAACDLVVMPSLTEGLPMVALEAMAAGRMVLASAVGELPQVLADGAGLLVPPGDAAALAESLRTALGATELRAATAAKARRRILDRYSAEATARSYAELLYAPALGAAQAVQSNSV